MRPLVSARGVRLALALAAVAVSLLLGSCTDVGLYASAGAGPALPDRAEMEGTVCVPLAGGDAFPVKVVFALQGGAGMDRNIVSSLETALDDVVKQFPSNYISFAVIAHHTIATGIQGSFVNDANKLQLALTQYAAFQEAGPVSQRAPLMLARSLISGDMQTGCRGQVARTRYYIVLIMATADESCQNPVFNAGIDADCNGFIRNGQPASYCSACELARVTELLKDTGKQYNAGEVTVQPIYIRTPASSDPDAVYEGSAIARAGGTQLIEAAPTDLGQVMQSLNYQSLQRSLKLKRLIALNRNVVVRNGQQYADSDGDGISDDQEDEIGTNKLLYDTDGDGLGDGVELKMGQSPLTQDVVSNCNYEADTDFDRLNDCEERVLGTDACIADTDGDTLPDLVEFLGGTNPLIPEDLDDNDGDGVANVEEITSHTDPNSGDKAFRQEHGYGYQVSPADPTPDGRACYNIHVFNIGLMDTLERDAPNGSGLRILRGTNDLYLYFQVGRDNDPRGTGIGSIFAQPVRFIPPSTRKPKGTIHFTDDDFNAGY